MAVAITNGWMDACFIDISNNLLKTRFLPIMRHINKWTDYYFTCMWFINTNVFDVIEGDFPVRNIKKKRINRRTEYKMKISYKSVSLKTRSERKREGGIYRTATSAKYRLYMNT